MQENIYREQEHKAFISIITLLLVIAFVGSSFAAKWQTMKFDHDIKGKLIQLEHYCATHDMNLEDVFWANNITSSGDIKSGMEILLPENKSDMLAIWQHQGAWQPKALVPVTSAAAARRAANLETPKVPEVPEVKLPQPSVPAQPEVKPVAPETPAKPEINTPSIPEVPSKTQTENIDLKKLLEQTQARRSESPKDAIREATKQGTDLKTLPAPSGSNSNSDKKKASSYNVPTNPIIILSPNGDPAEGPMRLIISGDKVEVVKLPAEAKPKRPSLLDLDHTFGTIPDYLQPYFNTPPRRPNDNIVMPNLSALNGKMLWPVDGKVTSGFGPRGRRRHTGLDIPMPLNTPIRAAKSGIVAKTGNNSTMGFRGYGNFVLMDHGGGVKTLYAHCSSVGVSEGMKIMQGQIVGYVGRTGRATTEHLHFEVRINDKPVNPIPYLATNTQMASRKK